MAIVLSALVWKAQTVWKNPKSKMCLTAKIKYDVHIILIIDSQNGTYTNI